MASRGALFSGTAKEEFDISYFIFQKGPGFHEPLDSRIDIWLCCFVASEIKPKFREFPTSRTASERSIGFADKFISKRCLIPRFHDKQREARLPERGRGSMLCCTSRKTFQKLDIWHFGFRKGFDLQTNRFRIDVLFCYFTANRVELGYSGVPAHDTEILRLLLSSWNFHLRITKRFRNHRLLFYGHVK